FTVNASSFYVHSSSVPLTLNVEGGVPSRLSILVDNPNTASATWNTYTATPTVNLGSAQGVHTVYVGLRGLPWNATQTWHAINLNLDTVSPTISISAPANNSTFTTSRIN